MKKSKKKHIIIALFLLLNFIQTLIPYNLLWAGNNGPKAPEAASFEPMDSSDVVNLLTGDFTYVLPLLNVPSPEGGYPLSLSYHSGIAMSQEASWVGLGWNVNPGAINRSIAGVPDDWKRIKKYRTIFNNGGISTSYSGGVMVGFTDNLGVGLYAAYSENKAFGGENSYNFDMGVSASYKLGSFGVSGSLGSNGVSAGASWNYRNGSENLNLGISASQSFKNGSTSIGTSASVSRSYQNITSMGSSVGFNLNSKNGASASVSVNSSSHQIVGGNSVSNKLNFKNDNFSITAPIGIVNINFGYQRNRYWLFDFESTAFNGSVYSGDFLSFKGEANFDNKIGTDSYEALFKTNNEKDIMNTKYSFLSYDSYSVTGQGISGSIAPKILEEGVLYNQFNTLRTDDNGYSKINSAYFYPNTFSAGFTKSIANNNLHFYFLNENSSYLKVNSDNWNQPFPSTNYSDIFSFDTENKNLNSLVEINGNTHLGYNSVNQRIRKGTYIETYTNNQLNNNPNLIIAPNNFNRSNSDLIPEDGIGAYKITTQDGKTYHYSLPVYQREKMSRTINIDKNEDNEFLESSQFEPYATHWLLTAITGPDYIDANGDHKLNKNDYGYWVEFDYGKWSDGFSWRTPTNVDDNKVYEETPLTKQYEWGVKDIYYLDKVITRTHTALFVKEIREDDQSSNINIRNGNDPKIYDDNFIQSFITGDDGNIYAKGVYDNLPAVYTPYINYFYYSKHKTYVKTNTHRSLKLSQIILLNNEDSYANVSKSNSQQSNPISGGEINISQYLKIYNTVGQFIDDDELEIHSRSWQGELFENVIDKKDIEINAPNINTHALKIIDFTQDYSTMYGSPNSTSSGNAKLTLKNVRFKGKNGTSLIPPYSFQYINSFINYDNNNKDNWGYNKTSIDDWNLKKIITPLGEALEINYEEDQYKQEAVPTSLVFEKKFKMKFSGTENGLKYVTFKNKNNNDPSENINFLDYFNMGEVSRVNVQYYADPSSNGGDRVIDVDKNCSVVAVTNESVKFSLPTSDVQSDKRNGATCQNENWVYYNWYEDVAGSWQTEHRADNCGEVGNGDYRTKIQFFSSTPEINKFGGGLRVKELILNNEDNGVSYSTTYNYNMPDNLTQSSGITSYSPSKRRKEVKYITEIPAPYVMYEYVTVTNKDSAGNEYYKDLYHFNVLKPMEETTNGFNMDGILSFNTSQNSSYSNVNINSENTNLKLSKFSITDNTASLGQLLSKTSFNSLGKVISEVNNKYYTNQEINQGILKETFRSYKKVHSDWSGENYFLSSSSRVYYPSIMKSTTSKKSGSISTTYFNDLDFLTGNPLSTLNILSNGKIIKKVTTPTYLISQYNTTYGMGPKVDDEDNKNMLSQTAIDYTFINNNNSWQPIGVGIQTWSNDWRYRNLGGLDAPAPYPEQKIWRKHASYIWDGDIDPQGLYVNYNIANDDGFNWNINATQSDQLEKWKLVSETTRYNHYSSPIEAKNLNNNYVSTKMGDYDSKVIATCNSKYTEMYFSGAEYVYEIDGNDILDGEIMGNNRTAQKFHTGRYSVKVTAPYQGAFALEMHGNEHKPGQYKISVWADKNNYTNARININNQRSVFNGEIVPAGDWVLLNHYFTIDNTSDTNIQLETNGGDIYYDDFRLHPVDASLISYVYSKDDELQIILDANNLGTKFEYDPAGRLTKTFQEVVDDPLNNVIGGFKKSSQNYYNYKN